MNSLMNTGNKELDRNSNRSRKKGIRRKTREAWSFIGPAAMVLLLVMLIPIIMVIYYSFFQNMIMEDSPFVGFKNYLSFFKDPDIAKMVRFTLIFTVGSVTLHQLIGLFLAVKLNGNINKIVLSVFRAIFILPWIFTAAVVAVAWQILLLPQGLINSMISAVSARRVLIDWLGRPELAILSLVVVSAWRGYPFCLTSFLAGLQSVPEVLYEAAGIDGANKRQMFFKVTLPQLKPVILSVALLDAIWTINLFPLIWLLTGGGPLSSTDSIATFTYRYAFVDFEFGVASAVAVVGLLVTMVITVLYVMKQQAVDE